jgi:hypothetical protein
VCLASAFVFFLGIPEPAAFSGIYQHCFFSTLNTCPLPYPNASDHTISPTGLKKPDASNMALSFSYMRIIYRDHFAARGQAAQLLVNGVGVGWALGVQACAATHKKKT